MHSPLRDNFQSIFQPSNQAQSAPPFSIENTKEHAADTLLRSRSSIPLRLCRNTEVASDVIVSRCRHEHGLSSLHKDACLQAGVHVMNAAWKAAECGKRRGKGEQK